MTVDKLSDMHLDNATDNAMLAAADWQIAVGVIALVVGLIGIILAGRSIRLAKQTADIAATTVREQRENRDYPSDRSIADEFAGAIRRIPLDGDIVFDAPDAREIKFTRFDEAAMEYVESITEPHGLLVYFNTRRNEIRAICDEVDDPADPMAASARRLGVNARMMEIRRIARDWPYPEKRPALKAELVKYLNIDVDGKPLA